MAAGLLEGKSGIKHHDADREASNISSNLHVFVSMGCDWPVEINIENKHMQRGELVVNELTLHCHKKGIFNYNCVVHGSYN